MLIIEILNWQLYNPRKDVKQPTWVRFQHNFFDNHEFYEFTATERLFWIYLLCLASQKNRATVHLVMSHAVSRVLNRADQRADQRADREHIDEEKIIHQAIEKLQRFQMIRIRTSRGRIADVRGRIATNERTNETDETRRGERENPPDGGVLPFDEPAVQELGFQEVVDLWNSTVTSLPRIRPIKVGSKYWKTLNNCKDDLDALFRKVEASDYLTGRNQKWEHCDFEWVIVPAHRQKILDGKYDNSKAAVKKVVMDEWMVKAEIFSKALKKYDSNSSRDREEFQRLHGDLIRMAAKAPGGILALRQLKDDQFYLRKIAIALKDGNDQLTFPGLDGEAGAPAP